MRKTLKSFVSLGIIFVLLCSILFVNVSAAGSSISFSKSSLSVGDTLTATVTLNAGEAMYGVSCVINYDSNVLEYKSGASTGGAGTLNIIESPSGETSVSYKISFTAKTAGSSSVSLADCSYATIGDGGSVQKPLNGASASVSVTDAALSSNANLRALSLSEGKLSPSFSASRTSYTVLVKNSITQCKIYATAADPNSKVVVSGSSKLEVGTTTRTVTVTAPNGTQKVYSIAITRSETDDIESESGEGNPLETTIDGLPYTIATDLSTVPLFKGFSLSETTFNGATVPVIVDGNSNYTLFYLKGAESEELIPYTYNATDNIFTKLNYLVQGENTYILASVPAGYVLPENYFNTNLSVSGLDISCYANSKDKIPDFYYLYCYFDNAYGFYRYDNSQNVLQRFPELTLISEEEALANLNVKNNIISKFLNLSNNSKIIVVGLLLLILAVIALLVLVIVKLIMRRREFLEDDDMIFEDDFDNVTPENFTLLMEEEATDNSDK